MRRVVNVLLISVIGVTGVIVALTVQGSEPEFITAEQAKEAVRAFEGISNLKFKTVKFYQYKEGPKRLHCFWYELEPEKGQPTKARMWKVDARTGKVVQVFYRDIITPEEAKEAVRAFEGMPNLKLKVVELCHFREGPFFCHWSYYKLEARVVDKKGQTKLWSWEVDARTGEVMRADYDVFLRLSPSDGRFDKDKCREIALKFAKEKYKGFDEMNLELIGEIWTTHYGWEFEWRQRLAYGAWGCNVVWVNVNPLDGSIIRYLALRSRQKQEPVRKPKITEREAIEIAKRKLKLVKVKKVSKPKLIAFPDGSTEWSLAIGGYTRSGMYIGAVMNIDAETGKVVYIAYECSGEG